MVFKSKSKIILQPCPIKRFVFSFYKIAKHSPHPLYPVAFEIVLNCCFKTKTLYAKINKADYYGNSTIVTHPLKKMSYCHIYTFNQRSGL